MAADALEPVIQMRSLIMSNTSSCTVSRCGTARPSSGTANWSSSLIPKNIRMETLSSPQCGQSKLGHAGAISATHAKQLLSIGSNAKE